MELHSYAKRRALKKWTIDQKRKLVEARISHDAWFTNKPSSLVPWKNILAAANLDDFNVFFVRKQWSNMLARYKQYKQTRLGSNIASKAIDAELIKRINQEWEFFEPIHRFMTRKTTNLHSYALTHRTDDNTSEQQEIGVELANNSTTKNREIQNEANKTLLTKFSNNDALTIGLPKYCAKENIPNNTTIVIQNHNSSQEDGINIFSSDTNEDFQVIGETTRIINGSKQYESAEIEEDENMNSVRNTDHDFYSKRSSLGDMAKSAKCHDEDELQEQQSNYFADASEESQGSLNMLADALQVNNPTSTKGSSSGKPAKEGKLPANVIKSENLTNCQSLDLKEEIHDQEFLNEMPSTSARGNSTQNITVPQTSTKSRLSQRDKYYRHKRHFNRRLEKRFDALLQVMSQVVKAKYPSVDVAPLVGTVTSLASSIGRVLSSDSEDENQNFV